MAGSQRAVALTPGSLRWLIPESSVERFQSLSGPDKMLSLSFFRDEQGVEGWRNMTAHRAFQEHGPAGVFADYSRRVADVARDYGCSSAQVPFDGRHKDGPPA